MIAKPVKTSPKVVVKYLTDGTLPGAAGAAAPPLAGGAPWQNIPDPLRQSEHHREARGGNTQGRQYAGT